MDGERELRESLLLACLDYDLYTLVKKRSAVLDFNETIFVLFII